MVAARSNDLYAILRSHEVAAHGYLHENPRAGGREEQRYWLRRSIEVIEQHTGCRPRGWRAPLYNHSNFSAELLAEEGVLYDASLIGDDVPYVLRTGKGDVVALPASGAYNLAMSSNYNLAQKPAVVMVKDGQARLIRRRETYADLVSAEQGL